MHGLRYSAISSCVPHCNGIVPGAHGMRHGSTSLISTVAWPSLSLSIVACSSQPQRTFTICSTYLLRPPDNPIPRLHSVLGGVASLWQYYRQRRLLGLLTHTHRQRIIF
jgi:hypothetical protein